MVLFHPQEYRHSEDSPKIKVQLVLTGIAEGLSALIPFEELRDGTLYDSYHIGATTITTTFGAAVPFLMCLEWRGITASGGIFQPDIAKLCGGNGYREEAEKLDDLTPRSQKWVNRWIFKKRVEKGAEDTSTYAPGTRSTLDPFKYSKENW
ncbi:hypothetical protein EKO27_g2893 [Xylaria grammica]|uniref:Uncharacterized protein n=1 Tax=Xylaria grammica TaxID=363999 RepID=A0A439DCV5_9PEZI|nr:hypothetical protein EKO27_g2893 [Xylaria grammica]